MPCAAVSPKPDGFPFSLLSHSIKIPSHAQDQEHQHGACAAELPGICDVNFVSHTLGDGISLSVWSCSICKRKKPTQGAAARAECPTPPGGGQILHLPSVQFNLYQGQVLPYNPGASDHRSVHLRHLDCTGGPPWYKWICTKGLGGICKLCITWTRSCNT